MTDTTRAAIQQLAEALVANPEDVKTLKVYGDLPSHLADALADYTDED